jgi:hypothetical protein
MQRHVLALTILFGLALLFPASLLGQAQDTRPVIDTIVIERNNVFTPEEAQSSGFFRVMNSLHIPTHRWVILQDLLFKKGETFDSARVAESERILRQKLIFRELNIDTTRIDDKFAVVVTTVDGWSTKPKFKFSIASDGTWTGTLGINEINLLGTGNQVYVAYQKDVDRDGLNLSLLFKRTFGWDFDAGGNYAGMSDGKNGNWKLGKPFRTLATGTSFEYDGVRADQRIIQFSRSDAGVLDSTFYRRTAFNNNGLGAFASIAQPTEYLRWAATATVRNEEYVLEAVDDESIPDTITGTLGAWGEYRKANYIQVRRFNGVAAEDLDMSTTIRLTANLTPKVFGWERSGIAPGIAATTAFLFPNGYVWGALDANGQFSGAGLDSGRVVLNVSVGWKPSSRLATVFQAQAGALDDPAPGQEFDLGFEYAPRSWEPHSFVGDREFWVMFEQRYFAVDALFNLIGVAFAAFFDYGGAWYTDQPSRFGGNAGLGLRMGSALGTVARTGRVDLGYRFGRDVTGDRWVISFGAGFIFPRRTIPVIQYSAQPPP